MNTVLQLLLQSRKNLQVTAGATAGGLLYILPVFVQLLGADKVASTIQHTSDTMAIVAVVLGLVLAILTALEDCARKVGVQVPPAAEKANADLAELKARFEAMAGVVRDIKAQAPAPAASQIPQVGKE